MKSFISPKAKKGEKSNISGRGLFAVCRIKQGEILAIKSGHILSRKKAQLLEEEFKTCPFLQITDDLYMGPKSADELEENLIFFNHSCNPNMGVKGQVIFVAMHDIEPGEEITVDYATVDTSEYKLICDCGSPFCRKIITGKDWKIKIYKKNIRVFFLVYSNEDS